MTPKADPRRSGRRGVRRVWLVRRPDRRSDPREAGRLERRAPAEEARGQVRWLRPEFQTPAGPQAAIQATFGIEEPEEGEAEEAAALPRTKLPWPKSLAEQAQAVRTALAGQRAPSRRAARQAVPACPARPDRGSARYAGVPGAGARPARRPLHRRHHRPRTEVAGEIGVDTDPATVDASDSLKQLLVLPRLGT